MSLVIAAGGAAHSELMDTGTKDASAEAPEGASVEETVQTASEWPPKQPPLDPWTTAVALSSIEEAPALSYLEREKQEKEADETDRKEIATLVEALVEKYTQGNVKPDMKKLRDDIMRDVLQTFEINDTNRGKFFHLRDVASEELKKQAKKIPKDPESAYTLLLASNKIMRTGQIIDEMEIAKFCLDSHRPDLLSKYLKEDLVEGLDDGQDADLKKAALVNWLTEFGDLPSDLVQGLSPEVKKQLSQDFADQSASLIYELEEERKKLDDPDYLRVNGDEGIEYAKKKIDELEKDLKEAERKQKIYSST